MSLPKTYYSDFYQLLAAIRNTTEARDLAQDLFTPNEIYTFAKRWQEIQYLAKGAPQRDVSAMLDISISKITRGSRVLSHGTGAFKTFLKRLNKPIHDHP
ncbi:transcriptional regulator [Candidatus Peregrinibacteria bacterium]|nr:transcriptional regulator [Candidatus Peregrinibacteria bacterium]